MRERVILSITNNVTINRETRANAIDDTTRARDENFDVDVYFSANYKKFNFDLFIADADAVVKGFIIRAIIIDVDAIVENFIIKIISFEMLVIRYLLSVFSTANTNT